MKAFGNLNDLFITSVTKAINKGELSISQRQAITKLIEKQWRQSLHTRLIKGLFIKCQHQNHSERLKNVFSSLISAQQTLKTNVVDICDCNNIGGYLVKIDIKKAFNSLDDCCI